MSITITDELCGLCGTELGQINGVMAITYYCRNPECFCPQRSEMTEWAKELLA